VAFSPSSQLLASVSDDNTVKLWDSKTEALCSSLEGHLYRVNTVAFSPNGQFLASVSYDIQIRL
jgi:WD40 repeat protein